MMRQQDWTDQLRDRLADYEAAVPEGLWADIEQSLPQQQAVVTPLWRRLVSTAAILTLAVGMGWWLWPKDEAQPLIARKAKAVDSPRHQPATQQPDVALMALAEARPAVPTPQPHASVSKESTEEPATPTTAAVETEEATKTEEVTQVTPPAARQQHTQTATATLQQRQQPTTTVATATKQRRTITIGLYANSELLPTSLGMDGEPPISQNDFDNNWWTTNQPPPSISNMEPPERYEEHHDHPIVAGLTVGIPLASRWTLGTGIVYTRLHSKLTTITYYSQSTTDQTLHYLGIPLNLQYYVLRGEQWKAYASAGTEVDWNLHTDADKKDRLQWSAGGAVGIEYNVVPQLGIYVEPGFRYYFDNHSSVRNFFKEQPFSWSLQMGVRLNLGQR